MPNSTRNLRIQWKGVISGPHTRAELDDMLAAGSVSLIHRVESGGRWQSVGDFLQRRPLLNRAASDTTEGETPVPLNLPGFLSETNAEVLRQSPLHRLEKLVLLGYILCGTTFVLPIVATVPALWLAFRAQHEGAREPARIQFILCGVFTVLGVLFYLLLHYIRREGWV